MGNFGKLGKMVQLRELFRENKLNNREFSRKQLTLGEFQKNNRLSGIFRKLADREFFGKPLNSGSFQEYSCKSKIYTKPVTIENFDTNSLISGIFWKTFHYRKSSRTKIAYREFLGKKTGVYREFLEAR